jgi:tellurite resistance protein TerC
MNLSIEMWVGFIVFLVVMLILDLAVFHRGSHVMSIKESLWWSVFWVALAVAFNVLIYFVYNRELALNFFTAYVLERSLSIDNLFVFLLVFNYFRVPAENQTRVLIWGIVLALIMRALFIAGGIALIHHFHAIIYLFGLFLIYTGYKIIFDQEKEIDLKKNVVLKLFCKIMPVTDGYHGERYCIRKDNRLHATPLLVVILVIATMDIVFAVDSIPAVLSITTDLFIVFTSNAFAVLGLRALYFALAGMATLFHYLNYGLGVILAFVGLKMLLEDVVKIPIGIALGFIAVVLATSIIASILNPKVEDRGEI